MWLCSQEDTEQTPGSQLPGASEDRVVFRLAIQMDKLEATFNYEDAGSQPLAKLSVEVSNHPYKLTQAISRLWTLKTEVQTWHAYAGHAFWVCRPSS